MNPILIISGIAALLLLNKKKATAAGNGTGTNGTTGAPDAPNVNPPDVAAALRLGLQGVKANYGTDVARNVERIFRLETGNFSSGLFKKTNAAGMKAFKPSYPFGWKARGTSPQDYAPVVTMAENAGGAPVQWVVFRQLPTALLYLGGFLADNANNGGRWNSTDPAMQAAYVAKLNNMSTSITDSLGG